MKISLHAFSKSLHDFERKWIEVYEKRIDKYIQFERTLHKERHQEKLASRLEKEVKKGAQLILLDEKGTQQTSQALAQHFAKCLENSPSNHLIVLIGGAYGYSLHIEQISHQKISLSSLTFPHRLALLIFYEQLYRSITLWRGEPYHHE